MRGLEGCKLAPIIDKDRAGQPMGYAKLVREGPYAPALVATDGRMLTVLGVELEENDTAPDGALIPREAIAEGAKRGAKVELSTEGVKIWTKAGGQLFFPLPKAADYGPFPRFEQVIPEDRSTVTVTLDAKRLAQLAASLGTDFLRVTITDDRSPILLQHTNGARNDTVEDSSRLGVLMPIIKEVKR